MTVENDNKPEESGKDKSWIDDLIYRASSDATGDKTLNFPDKEFLRKVYSKFDAVEYIDFLLAEAESYGEMDDKLEETLKELSDEQLQQYLDDEDSITPLDKQMQCSTLKQHIAAMGCYIQNELYVEQDDGWVELDPDLHCTLDGGSEIMLGNNPEELFYLSEFNLEQFKEDLEIAKEMMPEHEKRFLELEAAFEFNKNKGYDRGR